MSTPVARSAALYCRVIASCCTLDRIVLDEPARTMLTSMPNGASSHAVLQLQAVLEAVEFKHILGAAFAICHVHACGLQYYVNACTLACRAYCLSM